MAWEKVLREADFWRDDAVSFVGGAVTTGQSACRWRVEACRRLREAVDLWRAAGRPTPVEVEWDRLA